MAPQTPYSFIQCTCSGVHATPQQDPNASPVEEGDDEHTFDPRAPRANFSLFPLDYLLYCEDCHQIRCPRCVAEEIVVYFCPSCQFEVPTGNMRSDGTRCVRNCFQCPVCIGHLVVTHTESPPQQSLLSADNVPSAQSGPCVLVCTYCQWSSEEVGIKFEKQSGIYSQLAKIRNGGARRITARDLRDRRKDESDAPPLLEEDVDASLQYDALKAFYQTQLGDVAVSGSGRHRLGDFGFTSSERVAQIVSMYSRHESFNPRSALPKQEVMREARSTDEGLKVAKLDESGAIEKLLASSWDDLVSPEQNAHQVEPVRFSDELRPVPYFLRTKRSKRCPACRHIISKPEQKINNSRFRIRLAAGHYLPTIIIRPLTATSRMSVVALQPPKLLQPGKTTHFVMTFKNPIYEKVKVTLAAPSTTPGRFASKVTILCPQFEIDANTDMWDDALNQEEMQKRRAGNSRHQLEAGKEWDRDRNWVSIVLEVVPAAIKVDDPKIPGSYGTEESEPLGQDEDILEFPMFIRLEWEADAHHDIGTSVGKDRDTREKRELAYWSVLGIGRISQE